MSQVLRLGIIAAGLQLLIVALLLCFVSLSSLRELVIPVTKPAAPDAELAYRWAGPLARIVVIGIGRVALRDGER
jgi:hypothetical protein